MYTVVSVINFIMCTIDVVRHVGEVQAEVELDTEPVGLVEVWSWSNLVEPLLVVSPGVLQDEPDGLTQLESNDCTLGITVRAKPTYLFKSGRDTLTEHNTESMP